jgi:hypothetical protein
LALKLENSSQQVAKAKSKTKSLKQITYKEKPRTKQAHRWVSNLNEINKTHNSLQRGCGGYCKRCETYERIKNWRPGLSMTTHKIQRDPDEIVDGSDSRQGLGWGKKDEKC